MKHALRVAVGLACASIVGVLVDSNRPAYSCELGQPCTLLGRTGRCHIFCNEQFRCYSYCYAPLPTAPPIPTATQTPTPSPSPVSVACVGDCDGGNSVAVNEIITLVNIALGNAQPSACLHGVPSGAAGNIALIIQAVNSALNGCGG